MRLCAVLIVVTIMVACSRSPDPTPDEQTPLSGTDASVDSLGSASQELAETLLSTAGVVGVADGECNGQPCIRVMLEYEAPELIDKIPADYRGFPVEVEVSGEIRADD